MQTPRWQTGELCVLRLTYTAKNEGRDKRRRRKKRGQASGESNGYSRINPSIMSSASEFPRCGERLEIIKQNGTLAAVEGRRKGARKGGEWVAEGTGTSGDRGRFPHWQE